jgi:DNA-binding NarL/FixJ family response regulator
MAQTKSPAGAAFPGITQGEDRLPATTSLPARRARVAFVDDDADLLAGLRRALRRSGLDWDMSFHGDPRAALAALLADPADVVVADIRMPGLNGIDLAAALAERHAQTRTIVLSGSTDFDLAISSINVGRIFRYLVKPCPTPVLVAAVSAALRSRDAAAMASGGDLSAKAAIDQLKSGVIVLGPRGQVQFTNQRAGTLLARRDGILVENTGTCRASSMEATGRLHAAIRTARDAGTPDALTIETRDHGLLRVVVRPRVPDEDGTEPLICLYLFAADDDPAVDPNLLRGMFGLTPSESRLAAALARGLALEDAAAAEGWTVNSAKTYLKAVFAKVGVSRQAELVGVVLRNAGQ